MAIQFKHSRQPNSQPNNSPHPFVSVLKIKNHATFKTILISMLLATLITPLVFFIAGWLFNL